MTQLWNPAHRPTLDQEDGAVIRVVMIAQTADGGATIRVDLIGGPTTLHQKERVMIHVG